MVRSKKSRYSESFSLFPWKNVQFVIFSLQILELTFMLSSYLCLLAYLSINVTSFSSISNWSNSEWWPSELEGVANSSSLKDPGSNPTWGMVNVVDSYIYCCMIISGPESFSHFEILCILFWNISKLSFSSSWLGHKKYSRSRMD